MSKICPILNIDGPACYKEECAWWVESSGMCAVKDLARSTRAGNERLLKLTDKEVRAEEQLEYKACRCKACTGEKCLCDKFCPGFDPACEVEVCQKWREQNE